MREFVYGTNAQFNALDQELSQGKKYKFANRRLPESCSPATACMWFAKIDDVYCMYIDKGITTTADNLDFKNFLEHGETKFICLEDMVAFFHSLQGLFPQPNGTETTAIQQEENIQTAIMPTSNNASGGSCHQTQETTAGNASSSVVDMQKLKEIKAAEGKSKMVWPEELAAPLKEKVFGQDDVIDALADKIVINRMRKDSKLLVAALLGPPATGKSETARSLAKVMTEAYGVQYGYIEIAGSEFIGEHTVHRFFGAPPGYVGHGQATILDPVRSIPHHIIVINEIEKADVKILTGLMEAMDTGKLGMADNSKPIDLNRCILLFTSNIPIDMEKYTVSTEFERAEMCRDAFTKHCGRPEISSRVSSFMVYSPLSDDAVTEIIIKFVREELEHYNLRLGHIDEYLMAEFLRCRTKYGARGIRELVDDSVGRHLLRTRKLDKLKNKTVTMRGTIGDIEFEVA